MEAQFYHDQYCGTALTCRYILPDNVADMAKHQEVQARLICAISQVILDHPLMQVGMVGEKTKKPSFIRLDSINLEDLIEWYVVGPSEDYAATVDATLSEELDRRFTHPDTRPGWRIAVFRPEGSAFLDVLFNFKHTVSDGTGAKVFHRTLLQHVNNPAADPTQLGLQGNILTLNDANINYPPPMDSMGTFSLSLGFIVTSFWKQFKPPFLAKKPTPTQKSWGPYKPGPAKTQRRAIRICPEKTEKLVEACRTHQTTITGLLHGIVFAILLWETRSSGHAASFITSTAIDIRRFMSSEAPGMPGVEIDPHRTIANLLTLMEHEFDEVKVQELSKLMKEPIEGKGMAHLEDIVWAVAKSVRADVQAKLKRGLKNDIMGLMKFVGDWREEKARAVKKPRHESWQVTNLGIFDGAPSTGEVEKGSGWRIGRAVFSLCAETGRPLFVFSAVTVKDGDMCIDATWQGELNNYVEGIAGRLAPGLHAWLNYIATSEWQEDAMPAAFSYDLL